MKQTNRKKLISIILTVMLLIGAIPINMISAYATTTKVVNGGKISLKGADKVWGVVCEEFKSGTCSSSDSSYVKPYLGTSHSFGVTTPKVIKTTTTKNVDVSFTITTTSNKKITYKYTVEAGFDSSGKSSDNWHNETLKNTVVWVKKDVKLYKTSKLTGNSVGTLDSTMKASDGETVMRPAVIVDSENGNLKLKGDKIVNGKAVEFEGWLDPDNVVYANLAELNTDIDYDITNAYKSIFIVGDGTSYFNKNNNSYSSSSSTKGTNKCESTTYNKTNANTKYKSSYSTLPKITNKKLYTYDRFDGKNDGKVYSKKLGKNIFVAPVLWKFAKQIGYAECVAQRNGYDLKIYDTYRPQDICDDFYAAAVTATKSGAGNSLVTRTIAGRTWGLGWFVANSNRTTSDHARGIAVDLTLVRKDNNKEITTQSNMHDLSCNSIKTVSGWDNTYTNVLNKIMTVSNSKKSTMDTLVSEWWHYNITNSANYSATKYNVYYPKYTK